MTTSRTAEPSKSSVKSWMKKMVADYVDDKTNEVNATALAEGAADEFNAKDLGGWLDDEGHWVWEAAQEVSDEYERKHKRASERVAAKFSQKTATSPDQWEKAASLIEGGAKGDANRMLHPKIEELQAQLVRIQKAFTDAAKSLENHKKFGVGRTEAPSLLLRPLRELNEFSRLAKRAGMNVDKMVEGALRDTGGNSSDL